MAYDEKLADRVRGVLVDRRDVHEKKMFGGLAFMVRGHMCVGIVDRELMARIGPDASEKALTRPHVRPMDFTGRPLKGNGVHRAGGRAYRHGPAPMDRPGRRIRQIASAQEEGRKAQTHCKDTVKTPQSKAGQLYLLWLVAAAVASSRVAGGSSLSFDPHA